MSSEKAFWNCGTVNSTGFGQILIFPSLSQWRFQKLFNLTSFYFSRRFFRAFVYFERDIKRFVFEAIGDLFPKPFGGGAFISSKYFSSFRVSKFERNLTLEIIFIWTNKRAFSKVFLFRAFISDEAFPSLRVSHFERRLTSDLILLY